MPVWEVIHASGEKRLIEADAMVAIDGGKTLRFFNNPKTENDIVEQVAFVRLGAGTIVTPQKTPERRVIADL